MGENEGCRPVHPVRLENAPMPALVPRTERGLAGYATALCLLAVVAAAVSFLNGSWLGIVWILLAGVTSNMAWYYVRRARFHRADRTDAATTEAEPQ